MNSFCNDILGLIDNNILRTCNSNDGTVFFLKMKGDYHRYISEYAEGQAYEITKDKANDAYKKAISIADLELKTTNPIRLGLALNYSVFCYEVNIFLLIFIFFWTLFND